MDSKDAMSADRKFTASRKFTLSIEFPLPGNMVAYPLAREWELSKWAREQLARDLEHFCWTNQIPTAYVEYHVREVAEKVAEDCGVTLHVGDKFSDGVLKNHLRIIAIAGDDVWVAYHTLNLTSHDSHATWLKDNIIQHCHTLDGRRIAAIEP